LTGALRVHANDPLRQRWQEVAGILLRQRRLILTTVASGIVTAIVLAFLQGPTYKASAKLMVTSKRPRITVSPDPRNSPLLERVTEQDLNSEVALLQSETLVREVLADSREEMKPPKASGVMGWVEALVRLPLRLPGIVYRWMHGVPPPGPLDQWVEATVKHLSVTAIRDSNFVEVSYTGSQPEWVAELVNKLVRRHVERQVQLNQESDALGFFERQRQLLSDRLQKADEALRAFYARAGVELGSEERPALDARLAGVRTALAKAQTELAESTAREQFLSGELNRHSGLTRAAGGQAAGSPLQVIRSRLVELELQRSELLSTFAPTSIKVKDLDRRIAEARRLLDAEAKAGGGAANPARQTLALDLAQTQAQIAAVKAREQALQAQLTDDRAKIEHLDQIASQQQRLEQDVATAKEALLTYSKKQEEARFSDALDQSKIVNVTIVEFATVPTVPMRSKQPLILLMGVFLSTAAGVGLAFVRDHLDPSVKSAIDAETLTGLPILSEIP